MACPWRGRLGRGGSGSLWLRGATGGCWRRWWDAWWSTACSDAARTPGPRPCARTGSPKSVQVEAQRDPDRRTLDRLLVHRLRTHAEIAGEPLGGITEALAAGR